MDIVDYIIAFLEWNIALLDKIIDAGLPEQTGKCIALSFRFFVYNVCPVIAHWLEVLFIAK